MGLNAVYPNAAVSRKHQSFMTLYRAGPCKSCRSIHACRHFVMSTTSNQGNIWWVRFRQVTVDGLKYNGGMLRLAERLPREIYTREEQQVLGKELTSSLRTPS